MGSQLLVAFALLVLSCGAAAVAGRSLLQAAGIDGAYCKTFTNGCTAGDIRPGTAPTVVCSSGCFDVAGVQTCQAGTTVNVRITESLDFTTGASRYDITTITRTSPTSCNVQIGSNAAPFANVDGDTCGDSTGSITYTLQDVLLPCTAGASGNLVWNVCFGYDSNGAGGCATPLTAYNQITKPKCKCAQLSLPVRVASCEGVSCPAPGTGTVPSGPCINSGVCSATTNCGGATNGYCLTGQGPGAQQSCFYSYKTASDPPCRTSADQCDVPESCPGDSAACPVDRFKPAGTTCRPAVGPCDVAETCDGTSGACPPAAYTCSSSLGPYAQPFPTCTGTF